MSGWVGIWPMEKCDVLLSEEEIAGIIVDLAEQIAGDFSGRRLQLLGLLKGCQPFMADLSRSLFRLGVPLTMDYLRAKSYVGQQSGGTVALPAQYVLEDLLPTEPVLLIDDIFDTGETTRQVSALLRERGVSSIKVCVLLQKKGKEDQTGLVDYCGTIVPDVFVVGYGLDYNQRYRELPFIMTLPPEGAG